MDLIIETDLGRDPDDFFAICYLAATGVDVRAILISPGDPDQVAIARLLCEIIGLKIPIGVAKKDRTKRSSGGIHSDLLRKYKKPLEATPDGLGVEILGNVLEEHPDAEFFVIGPVTSVGSYLEKYPRKIRRATMQGGFLGYDLAVPTTKLPQFEGKSWMPTFNLNGDRPNGESFLKADISERRMVGKNVCHTVLYDSSRYESCKKTGHPAIKLFCEASELYLAKHSEKKFHDPTAACLHLHPEIGTWFRGKTTKMESGWGTIPDPDGDYICADIDYNLLWSHLMEFK